MNASGGDEVHEAECAITADGVEDDLGRGIGADGAGVGESFIAVEKIK